MSKNSLGKRCDWCGTNELYCRYHDEEWGVPVKDEKTLFEFLILEGAQAGLSWFTILKKREYYREAFHGFDPEKVARMTAKNVVKLMKNPKIVRNKLKIESSIGNAKAFLKIQEEFGSFASYQWNFVGNKPLQNKLKTLKQAPARTAISDRFSADLKKRGFKFVGSTIIYAHMQATGMVNDHLLSCPRYRVVEELGKKFSL